VSTKVGDRVFAIRNADDQTVYMFGRGVYQGRQPCARMDGYDNPKILLDDGNVVWGCECWWALETREKEYVAGRPIEIVPPPTSDGNAETEVK
jgi:hypothetical protein